MSSRLQPVTPEPIDRARTDQRRRKHERQAVVFGLLIAFLAVAGLGALAVYTNAFELPNQPDFIVKEKAGTKITADQPCAPSGTLALTPKNVHITVLNGSARAGLAGTVAELLKNRGFAVDGTGNDGRQLARPLISFGAKGVAAAYTLRLHYPEAQLVLDSRKGKGIDLAVPDSFSNLEPEESISVDPESDLPSAPDCKPIADITPQPAPQRIVEEQKAKDTGKKPAKKPAKKVVKG